MDIVKIYQENIEMLYRYAMARLNNKHDVEDVISEVFLRLANKQELGHDNVKGWLIVTARNIIFETYRKRNETLPAGENIAFAELEEEMQQPIDEILDKSEVIKMSSEALNSLSENEREIIQLKIWEEFSFDEIAHMLNEKQSKVKSAYYRSLLKLKKFIESKPNYQMLYAFNLPLLVWSIHAVKSQFAINAAMQQQLAHNLFNFSSKIMQNSVNSVLPDNAIAASAAKALPALTKGKMLLAAAALVVGVGATGTVVVLNNNKDSDPVAEERTMPTVTPEITITSTNVPSEVTPVVTVPSVEYKEYTRTYTTYLNIVKAVVGTTNWDEFNYMFNQDPKIVNFEYPANWNIQVRTYDMLEIYDENNKLVASSNPGLIKKPNNTRTCYDTYPAPPQEVEGPTGVWKTEVKETVSYDNKTGAFLQLKAVSVDHTPAGTLRNNYCVDLDLYAFALYVPSDASEQNIELVKHILATMEIS